MAIFANFTCYIYIVLCSALVALQWQWNRWPWMATSGCVNDCFRLCN